VNQDTFLPVFCTKSDLTTLPTLWQFRLNTFCICLRQMAACDPDIIVYNNLLAVYQQKQDWQRATSVLKEVASSLKGLRRDVVGALAFANG